MELRPHAGGSRRHRAGNDAVTGLDIRIYLW